MAETQDITNNEGSAFKFVNQLSPGGSRTEQKAVSKAPGVSKDSGLYGLPTDLKRLESEALSNLIKHNLAKVTQKISKAIAGALFRKTPKDRDPMISVGKLARKSKRTALGSPQTVTLVPQIDCLKEEDLGLQEIKPMRLSKFFGDLVETSFHVYKRAFTVEELRIQTQWAFDLLFDGIDITESGVFEPDDIKLIEKRISSPELQLTHSTLLRTLLILFTDELLEKKESVKEEERATEIEKLTKAMVYKGEQQKEINEIRRNGAVFNVLKAKGGAEQDASENNKSNANMLYDALTDTNPLLEIHHAATKYDISFLDFCASYIKISDMSSKMAYTSSSPEYENSLIRLRLENLTAGIFVEAQDSSLEDHVKTISERINTSNDPTINALREFLARRETKKASRR